MNFKLNLPRNKPFQVVGMGLNAVDHLLLLPHFPRFNSKLKVLGSSVCGGGQVASPLVCLSRLGFSCRYIGSFGDDWQGEFSRQSLETEKIDLEYSRVLPDTKNQHAYILVEPEGGERTILWDRPPALYWQPEELPQAALLSGQILLLDGHESEAAAHAAKIAKSAGIPVLVDAETVKPGTAELVANADFVIADTDFPLSFTGEADLEKALALIQAKGPAFVGVTLGKEGSLCLYQGEFLRTPGFKVEAVDTTGAGDAFHAGFIAGLLKGYSVEDTLKFANAVAALSCRGLGGRAALPGNFAEVFAVFPRDFEGWN